MGSKKRSAWAKQASEFKASLGGMDDVFAREGERMARQGQQHEAALRKKSCESKNRYATQADAEEAIYLCAEHGTRGLRCYRCPYCEGWHLTSKPE